MLIETKIISKARGEGAPLPAAKIESFLSEHSDLSESELILLRAASSLHKYIVGVDTVSVPPDSKQSADIHVKGVLGASWDSKKDGYYAFNVAKDGQVSKLVKVIWISND